MAKKKKKVTKKTASRRGAKKVVNPPKKKAASKKAPARSTSVDNLLKKYEKERKAQEAKLTLSRQKVAELELKATKLQEQIEKLKEQASTTQGEISQLDTRRDADIAEVLGRLGVQLSASSQAESLPELTLGSRPSSRDDANNR